MDAQAHDDPVQRERDALAAAGVAHFHVPSREVPDADTVDAVLALLDRPENHPALVHCKHGVQRATVTSAVPLTEAELARLHRELETLTGGRIVLATAVDASLTGGAQVRIGDRLIDRSVKTMLEAIEQRLMHTSV